MQAYSVDVWIYIFGISTQPTTLDQKKIYIYRLLDRIIHVAGDTFNTNSFIFIYA